MASRKAKAKAARAQRAQARINRRTRVVQPTKHQRTPSYSFQIPLPHPPQSTYTQKREQRRNFEITYNSILYEIENRTPISLSKSKSKRLRQLKAHNQYYLDAANARYKELSRAGLLSPSMQRILESGGEFSFKGLRSESQLMIELQRAETFLTDPTSDIDTAKFVEMQAKAIMNYQSANRDIFHGTDSDTELKDFWSIIDRLREDDAFNSLVMRDSDPQGTSYLYAYYEYTSTQSELDMEQVVRDAFQKYIFESAKARGYGLDTRSQAEQFAETYLGKERVRRWENR